MHDVQTWMSRGPAFPLAGKQQVRNGQISLPGVRFVTAALISAEPDVFMMEQAVAQVRDRCDIWFDGQQPPARAQHPRRLVQKQVRIAKVVQQIDDYEVAG